MALDATKLSPAPWLRIGYKVTGTVDAPGETDIGPGDFFILANCYSGPRAPRPEIGVTNAEFIALARQAFDVMMRRGWFPVPNCGDKVTVWFVNKHNFIGNGCPYELRNMPRAEYPDPFTALVEADRWYAANVEGQPQ